MGFIIAEYIWLDAGKQMRGKAKTIITDDEDITLDTFPVWVFDGSSTGQASGKITDIIIKPCDVYRDPFRGEGNFIVLCDCYDSNDDPIQTNKRYHANKIFKRFEKEKTLFGIEQEYVLYDLSTKKPLGWPKYTQMEPQGKYYCGVGCDRIFGRKIVEQHYKYCLYAGLHVSGINAEVMPSQWEYQIGPVEGISACDELWVSRYILQRICEEHGVYVSFNPKPQEGDWNGSGCHVNYSTQKMRDENGIDEIYKAINKLKTKHDEHIMVYGDNTKRLTGKHETSDAKKFSWGVGDRAASIRIPLLVHKNKKGYLEDRRPASDMDPYMALGKIVDTTNE